MTDMEHPSLSDDDIRRLLNAVTTDDSIRLPNKDALRDRVIDEFRTGLSSGTPQLDEQSAHDPVVVELSIEVLAEKRSIPWRRIILSAAAVVLAVIGVVNLTVSPSEDTVEAAGDETRPLDAPGSLDPGRHFVGSVAGGIEFATSSAVVATQLEPGLVVVQPTQGDSAASLSIMSADGPLEELLEGYRDAGVVRLVLGGALSPNGAITEFEVRLQPGASAQGCARAAACLTIGRVTIESGSVVTVREFVGPDGSRVWSLYQSEQYLDPFRSEANLIQESLEIIPDP